MYKILKMRLPAKEEWDQLVAITGGNDNIIHCNGVYSWGQDVSPTRNSDRIALGMHSGYTWSYYPSGSINTIIGFRPVFEVAGAEDVADGEIVALGTLYVYGYPIKVPEVKGNLCGYMPRVSVELREAMDDPAFQLRAIKVGKVFIADRVMLNRISWDDLQDICKSKPEIRSVRLPTIAEWDHLVDIVGETRAGIHFGNMLSWCKDTPNNHDKTWQEIRGWAPCREDCGCAANRNPNIGFRPVFELVNPNILANGAVAMAGTLYMGGLPVKIPVSLADTPDYAPGDKLEFREALSNPAYQIRAIKVGRILVADRVLLKNISWFSANGAYVCRPGKGLCTWKVPAETFVAVEANSVEEALTIAARKADHIGASLRCQTPEEYLAYLNS